MYGAHIAAAMKRAGVDASELARRVGYSTPDMIYKITKDKANPSLEQLDRIADALNMRIGDLLPNSGGSPVEDRFQPLMAAMMGLSEDDTDDMILRLAEIARQMSGWRRRDALAATVQPVSSMRENTSQIQPQSVPSVRPSAPHENIDVPQPALPLGHRPVFADRMETGGKSAVQQREVQSGKGRKG